MEIKGLHFLILSCHFLCWIAAFQTDVPSNFYGSPEVFSGYLSNTEVFIEAFTLHDDHVSISGSTQEVEHALETINTKGKNREYFSLQNIYV